MRPVHSLSGQHNKPINTHCVTYMLHTNTAYSMEREIWWNDRNGRIGGMTEMEELVEWQKWKNWWNDRNGRIGGNSQIFLIRLQAD